MAGQTDYTVWPWEHSRGWGSGGYISGIAELSIWESWHTWLNLALYFSLFFVFKKRKIQSYSHFRLLLLPFVHLFFQFHLSTFQQSFFFFFKRKQLLGSRLWQRSSSGNELQDFMHATVSCTQSFSGTSFSTFPMAIVFPVGACRGKKVSL